MRLQELIENDEPTRIKIGGGNVAAKAFIEKVYAKYPHTMQNNHVMVWGEGDAQQFAMFELTPSFSKRGAVEVKWFQAYPLRAGVGSKAMKELQALAREDGIALTLFPWDKGQVSQAKLTKFYKGQGFAPIHKGSKSMAWETVEEADSVTVGQSLVRSKGTKFQIGNSYIDIQHTGLLYAPRGQSIIDFVVDETLRGQGIGKKLLAYVMKHFSDLGAQASSTASISVLYNAGFRSPANPNATVAELDKIRREDSSVFLAQNDQDGHPYKARL